MRNKTFALTTLLAIAGYSIFLYFSGNLGLYIHPRFFEESLAAGFIGVVVVLIYTLLLIRKKKTFYLDELVLVFFFLSGIFINIILLIFGLFFIVQYRAQIKISLVNLLIISTMGLMITLPPASLSSFTASQRAADLTNLNINNANRKLVNSFTSNTENLTLGDWIASLTYNPDHSDYINKKVKVSGFMFRTEDITNEDFIVARFVIACCAVDARPVGIKVKNVDIVDFKKDQWIEVKGTFQEENGELLIIPDEVNSILQPDQPYIY